MKRILLVLTVALVMVAMVAATAAPAFAAAGGNGGGATVQNLGCSGLTGPTTCHDTLTPSGNENISGHIH